MRLNQTPSPAPTAAWHSRVPLSCPSQLGLISELNSAVKKKRTELSQLSVGSARMQVGLQMPYMQTAGSCAFQRWHADVCSSAKFVGVATQFLDVWGATKLQLQVDGLTARPGARQVDRQRGDHADACMSSFNRPVASIQLAVADPCASVTWLIDAMFS
jgi:hypothetical protein